MTYCFSPAFYSSLSYLSLFEILKSQEYLVIFFICKYHKQEPNAIFFKSDVVAAYKVDSCVTILT